jgi:hypothetical protein
VPFNHAGLYGPQPAVDSSNNLLIGATIQVNLTGTTTAAVLYTSAAKTTVAANPVTVAAPLANLAFYAAPGLYDLVTTYHGVIYPAVTVEVFPSELDVSNKTTLATFTQNPLAVAAGVGLFPLDGDFSGLGAIATCSIAPTVTPIIVDLLYNGATVYTTTANRPTIGVGAKASPTVEAAPDVTTWAKGGQLSLSTVQTGAIAQGVLTVAITGIRLS